MTSPRPRPYLLFGLAAVLAVVCLVWLVVVVAHVFPPRTVVITTGPERGADYELGERYAAILEQKGIRLKLATSAGKLENLQRLKDPRSGYLAGFSSGGLTTAAEAPGVLSLGTIAYDPLWIFCRDVPEPVLFSNLTGKRVSIGPEGSGTRALVLALLRLNKLENVIRPIPLSSREGGEALLRGEIDCACMLTYAESTVVRKLLADDKINLMNFPRADAYVALYPFLRKVVLPMGVGDLAANRPPHDVTLIAAAESLLVREGLHPAIQYLLLQAAEEIHSRAGILQQAGHFPAPEPVDLPLSKEARQFYKSGPTFLQRHLPFWLWVFASNLIVVLVPLLGVVYPLVQLVPAAVRFEMERRLTNLYKELRDIEERIDAPGPPDGQVRADLDRLDAKIHAVRVPASYARSLYTLKQHAALVRERLNRGATTTPGPGGH